MTNYKNYPYFTENKGDKALLFIHGFLDSKDVWKKLSVQLHAPGFEKVYFDLPGMGDQCGWSDKIDLESLSENALKVVDSINKPITIVAHSMGAQIAEIIATKRPNLIEGMVLVTPIPITGLKVSPLISAAMRNSSGKKMMHKIMRNKFCKGASDETIMSLVENGIKVSPQNVKGLFDSWTDGYAQAGEMFPYDIPVMVISGEKDMFSTPKVCKKIIGLRFKNFTYKSISDASHWPHVNRYKIVANYINEYLESKEKQNIKVSVNPNHPNCLGNVTEYKWADAFAAKDTSKFMGIFQKDATQTAATSPFITHGAKDIAETFGWASDFYKRCDFTYQAVSDNVVFLEFDLTTKNDMHMTGMTVLTKNKDGKVIKVFNGHRNLKEIMLFCEHFVKGTDGVGIASMFYIKSIGTYGLEPKFARNPNGVMVTNGVTEKEYIDAFRDGTVEKFKDVLAENVILSGSYVTDTIRGIDDVSYCLASVADYYEHCIFTIQAQFKNRTYLLYKGCLRNELVVSDGFLILVRDDSGKIVEVLDNPIPLSAGMVLSAYLAKKTAKDITSGKYFYRSTLFKEAAEKYGLENVYGEHTQKLNPLITNRFSFSLILKFMKWRERLKKKR